MSRAKLVPGGNSKFV